ncbi:MAG: zinc ribbon domain-containing protein [Candidatus Thorarchaeota archaeon]
MVHDRYYSKERYESTYGSFFCGGVFIFVAILSLVLMTIRSNFDPAGLQGWGYWLFIPGFLILFFGGFQQLYTNNKFRKSVKNAILNYESPGTYKLEDIALEVGIKPNDLLRVLSDLRASGVLTYKFNSQSGEIELGQKVTYQRSEAYSPPKKIVESISPEGKNYCVYCGHKIREGASFCENCGSKI